MYGNSDNKNKKRKLYISIIRIVAAVITAILLYFYFYKDIRLQELGSTLNNLTGSKNILYILFAILLMPANWHLESAKWRMIMNHEYTMKWKEAFIGVFQGLSLGILTPGRIGEYGGRILRLPAEYRPFGTLATFICSLGQNLVNISAGFIGLLWITESEINIANQQSTMIVSFLIVIFLIGIALFKLNYFLKYLSKFKWIRKRISSAVIDFTDDWTYQSKWKLVALSFLRYSVYVLQYVFVLYAFSVDITWTNMISGIAIVFAIQTLIPLTPILQFTVRGSIVLWIFGNLCQQDEAVFISSYAMWFLNLLIPAILGSVWLLFSRWKSS